MQKLKLTEVISERSGANWVIDPVVRVDIGIVHLHRRAADRYLEWRLDDPIANLIEIDLDRDSGELRSMAILFLRASVIYPLGTVQENSSERNAIGVPVFALDVWASALENDPRDIEIHLYDYPGRCRFELGEKELRVILFPDVISYRVTTTDGKLACDFNETNELCAFMIIGLDATERAMFAEKLST